MNIPEGNDERWPQFRVLCVDDNHDCADSSALLLRTVGFEARSCYEGKEALSLNDDFRPSVCLIDLNMAGMDGCELAECLRQRQTWKPLLLIAITAMSDHVSHARIVAAGFAMHLVKPVAPDKLVEVVNLIFRIAETEKWITSGWPQHVTRRNERK